jgi:hypothetical protein
MLNLKPPRHTPTLRTPAIQSGANACLAQNAIVAGLMFNPPDRLLIAEQVRQPKRQAGDECDHHEAQEQQAEIT